MENIGGFTPYKSKTGYEFQFYLVLVIEDDMTYVYAPMLSAILQNDQHLNVNQNNFV